jgi:hypothetical protein
MPAARDAHVSSFARRALDGSLEAAEIRGRDDLAHVRRIELGVNVIDENAVILWEGL